MDDVAIVGLGCRFPRAQDVCAFWELVKGGSTAFAPVPASRWKHSRFYDPDPRSREKTYTDRVALIDGVDGFAALHHGISPRRAQVMDPQQRLAIEVAREALQDAGWELRPPDGARVGVYVGASTSEYRDLLGARLRALMMMDGAYGHAPEGASAEAAVSALVQDLVYTRAFTLPGSLLSMIAAAVSQTFDFGGPSFTVDAACASSLVAVHQAVRAIRSGECEVALAGGAYLALSPDAMVGFSRIGAISRSGVCRPFDRRADGFVLGEGVGVAVLRRAGDARAAGDRIYALIRGSACVNDGRAEGPMAPRVEGQLRALEQAYADARVPPTSVELLEAHGTATAAGDAVEVEALKRFWRSGGAEGARTLLTSVKASIGHTMSAAGIAGLIRAALALHHRQLPAQPGCEPHPALGLERSPFRLSGEPAAWAPPGGHPRRAGVSAFGFGGTNVHVVLEEAPAPERPAAEELELFLLSAPSPELLRSYAGTLGAAVAAQPELGAGEVAQALAARRPMAARAAVLARGRAELLERLKQLAAGDGTVGPGAAASAPRIAFLFPGQGAQRIGLLEDLYARFPAFRRRMDELDMASLSAGGPALVEALYPCRFGRPFDPELAQRHLTQTQVAQPALAALGISLAELLARAGVKPAMALGHSLGELTAAAAVGMLRGEDAVGLAARRGRAMAELPLGDRGAMLAAHGEARSVEAAIAGVAGVVVANLNHPGQVVLSGTTGGIRDAEAALGGAGIRSNRLEVSHAFHSPLMDGLRPAMDGLLAGLEVRPAEVPLVSCISGAKVEGPGEAKELWARHATAQVSFHEALKACAALGVDAFIQVGAGSSLLSFARTVPGAAERMFLGAASAEPDGGAQLLTALGQLWVSGAPVDLRELFAGAPRAMATLPPSPLETQRYWAIERQPRAAAAPVLEAPGAGAGPPEALLAHFREQNAVLKAHAELLLAQNTVLAREGVSVPVPPAAPVVDIVKEELLVAAPPPAAPIVDVVKKELPVAALLAAPPPIVPVVGVVKEELPVAALLVAPEPPVLKKRGAAPVRGVSEAEVRAAVIESVARISAFPPSALKMEQALVNDLGFDSLMLVELESDVAEAWPAIRDLPRSLLRHETTIQEVIAFISASLSGAAPKAGVPERASAAEPSARNALELYRPAVTDAPDAVPETDGIDLPGRILVTRDARGVADALIARLRAAGVCIADDAEPGPVDGVVDVRGLDAPSDERGRLLSLFSLARRVSRSPSCFVVVAGSDPVACGFTKALSREWPSARVKVVETVLPPRPADLAAPLFEELRCTDRSPEIRLDGKRRTVISLERAETSTPISLPSDSVALVSGGARGVGLQLALALASRYRCRLALLGRSPPNGDSASALEAIRSAGGEATYHQVDVRDASAVAAAASTIRSERGPIRAVIHAAGVLADGPVRERDDRAATAVLDTKLAGARALLAATASDQLALFAAVSSWAARFGNALQCDYSAANEAMNRLCAGSPRRLSLLYPPWDGTAMVKGIPAFARQELEAAGVPFIDDAQGRGAFLAALDGGCSGEVLLGRDLPVRLCEHRASTLLSTQTHPFLSDHQLAGQPVLPLAAAMDAAATAALASLGSTDGAFTLRSFRLHRGVVVPEPTRMEISCRWAERPGISSELSVELHSGRALGSRSVAYRGVVSAGADSILPAPATAPPPGPLPLSLDDFYRSHTFHGPLLRGITRIEAMGPGGISGWVQGCSRDEWIRGAAGVWAIDPKVIDSSFQLAGYWAWVTRHRAGLPKGFQQHVQLHPFGPGQIRCVLSLEAQSGTRLTGTIHYFAEDGRLLAVMTGAEAELLEEQQRTPETSRSTPATHCVN